VQTTRTAPRAREERYSLRDGQESEDGNWRYHLYDPSPENIRALVGDGAVNDTHGVDRGSGQVTQEAPADDADATDQLLIGTRTCDSSATVDVRVVDQPSGLVAVDVDAQSGGLVFFSEPYFPSRAAFVDGRRVDLQKAGLAFSAVAMPAGRHVVELRIVPRAFQWGLATTMLTLVCWIGVQARSRRRRP
jgi:hypothetical protein